MQGPEGHSFIAHKKSVEVEEESSFGFLIKLEVYSLAYNGLLYTLHIL